MIPTNRKDEIIHFLEIAGLSLDIINFKEDYTEDEMTDLLDKAKMLFSIVKPFKINYIKELQHALESHLINNVSSDLCDYLYDECTLVYKDKKKDTLYYTGDIFNYETVVSEEEHTPKVTILRNRFDVIGEHDSLMRHNEDLIYRMIPKIENMLNEEVKEPFQLMQREFGFKLSNEWNKLKI